jgi:paraquat-inducible protein B
MSEASGKPQANEAREARQSHAGGGALPVARVRVSRWPGLIWAVPLAALIIVAFLGMRALAERGIDVVVTFDTAAGARVDDTKVIYQGVEAGKVTRIDINRDGHRVDMTLRLDRDAEPGLTTGTKFWLIGAKPNLNDIASVKAALAGLAIGVAPGVGGAPARRFEGSSEPPIFMPGTPGTAYVLSCDDLGTARVRSALFYRGQEIGRVTAVRFVGPRDFQLDVFVVAPFDQLIRPAAAFWISNPVQVALTDNGASATLQHAGALLNGAIELELPQGARTAAQSPAGTPFRLYQNRRDAESGPTGPGVPYAFRFSGPAGDLAEGAPVRLLGFQVGAVRSVKLEIDPHTGGATTTVEAVLYPLKLRVAGPLGSADPAAWRRPTDAAVSRLLARGHRARLIQTPPLIGGRAISLDPVAGAGAAGLRAGEPALIPSDDAAGGVEEMTGQVNQILAKVNRIPFDTIGEQVRQLTTRLNAAVASPQWTDSLRHLDSSLAQVDRMMTEVAPQVGPLVGKLNRAADAVNGTVAAAREVLGGADAGAATPDASVPATLQQLGDAARAIRALAEYLGRHPEALLRGRDASLATGSTKEGR